MNTNLSPAGVNEQWCTLIVARHGRTDWNAAGRIQGHTDIPLNADGERDAATLAERLIDAPLTRIYASDLRRAFRTAEIIAQTHTLPVQTAEDLRERCFGSLEGHPVSELERLYFTGNEGSIASAGDGNPDGVEREESVNVRFRGALHRIAATHLGETVLVVTHGGPMLQLYRNVRAGSGRTSPLSIDNAAFMIIEATAVAMRFRGATGFDEDQDW